MTCQDLTDFIDDYLSHELPWQTRQVFEDHLSRCENCRTYLAGYQQAIALGGHAFEEGDAAIPATFPEELVQAILSAATVAKERPRQNPCNS